MYRRSTGYVPHGRVDGEGKRGVTDDRQRDFVSVSRSADPRAALNVQSGGFGPHKAVRMIFIKCRIDSSGWRGKEVKIHRSNLPPISTLSRDHAASGGGHNHPGDQVHVFPNFLPFFSYGFTTLLISHCSERRSKRGGIETEIVSRDLDGGDLGQSSLGFCVACYLIVTERLFRRNTLYLRCLCGCGAWYARRLTDRSSRGVKHS